MRRKTATIVAIAGLAFATTMFPSGRDAAALAQAATDQPTLPAVAEQVELVPEVISFVSEPVVQPLPAETQSPTLTEAGSLTELVGMVDTDAPMNEQLRCLAGAVYFEARGEPLAGQLAVAQVVINRLESPKFPKTICGIALQRNQFFNVHAYNPPKDKRWDTAVQIAMDARAGISEPALASVRATSSTARCCGVVMGTLRGLPPFVHEPLSAM